MVKLMAIHWLVRDMNRTMLSGEDAMMKAQAKSIRFLMSVCTLVR